MTDFTGSYVLNFAVIGTEGENSDPVLSNPIPDQFLKIGDSLNYTFPENTFTDADKDTLTYDITNAIPDWLTFDASTRNFSGTPDSTGRTAIILRATDGRKTVTDAFDIIVNPPGNSAPVVDNPIPNQMATVGTAFSYTIPSNTFFDPDGDTLKYSTNKRPYWLNFNADTLEFSGTPDSAGTLSPVTVTADDGNGNKTEESFDIVISEVGSEPDPNRQIINKYSDDLAVLTSEQVIGAINAQRRGRANIIIAGQDFHESMSADDVQTTHQREISVNEFMNTSSFNFSENENSFWGSAAFSNFSDGKVNSIIIGSETSADDYTMGVALSLSNTKSDDGEINGTVNGLYPYVKFQINSEISGWAIVGFSNGSLNLNQKNYDYQSSLIALGGQGTILQTERNTISVVGQVSDQTETKIGVSSDWIIPEKNLELYLTGYDNSEVQGNAIWEIPKQRTTIGLTGVTSKTQNTIAASVLYDYSENSTVHLTNEAIETQYRFNSDSSFIPTVGLRFAEDTNPEVNWNISNENLSLSGTHNQMSMHYIIKW